MLRHRLASPLLLVLRQHSAVLCLPELVKLEVRQHLVEKHAGAAKRARQAIGEVRQLLGAAPDFPEATDEQVASAFEQRLAQLGDLLVELPLRDEDLAAAGRMVLDMVPPNSRTDQQFKDSLLWRAVLTVADEYNVVFVSDDGDYFDKSGKLAANLAAEAEQAPLEITVVRRIEDLLDMWQSGEVDLSEDFSEEFEGAVRRELEELLPQHTDLQLSNVVELYFNTFITENPDELAVSGEFEIELVNPELSTLEPTGLVTGEASAILGIEEGDLRSIGLDHVSIDLLTPHGDLNVARVSASAGSVGSGTMRRYEVRQPVEIRIW